MGIRRWIGNSICLAALALPLFAQVNVLTYQGDNSRAGAYLNETILTPSNVNAKQFGKIFQHSVDGQVYAQPLIQTAVAVAGRGTHNVVFVATEHDTVYAFDADSAAGLNAEALWQVNFSDPANGVVPVPASDYLRCPAVVPEIGITGTPVIDAAAGTLYVVAMTKETKGQAVEYVYRLHALDVTNGKERAGSPVKIEASIAGTGDENDKVVFNARKQKQRPGLLLLNGVVYTAWGSQCERLETYHGWLLGYDAKTLKQVAVFNTSPDGTEASIWESGAAPAADADANVYLVTGNGSFNHATGGRNLGEAYLKLSTRRGMALDDYFTPFNYVRLNRHDIDLGSSGVAVLPDDAGSKEHPHLLVGSGKEGRIYLLDRDHLGGFHEVSDSQIVQSVEGGVTSLFGKPAYFHHSLYFCGSGDPLKQLTITDAKINPAPTSQTKTEFNYPGCQPVVSANGDADGIVWLLEAAGILHAYDASNVAKELYNSGEDAGRDALGEFVKFSVPTIANGKVYAGTANSLVVYGLLPPPRSADRPK
jgi:hypothetical protein